MKKIFALLIILVFLASIFSLPSLARTPLKQDMGISEKKESLTESTIKIKDYVTSARDSIESSNLISESEKAVIIEKLNEKSIKMDSYISQIENIDSKTEVDEMKFKLKEDIKEIKPLTEKSIIIIQKDKISNSISKLKSISKKLGMIMPFLDKEEKSKAKELKNLVDSANEKLEKAEKLSRKEQSNPDEIRSLLKDATKDIKEAFSIVREILSQIESDVLNDIENYESKKDEISEPKIKSDNSCDKYIMTWHDEAGNIARKEDYKVMEDTCKGYRTILGYEISPSCYNKEQCNTLTLKCVSVDKLKKEWKECNSKDGEQEIDKELTRNIYVDLNEAFELKEGDSAKAIIDKNDGSKDSIIITLKQIIRNGDNSSTAGTNVNYWINNENVKNVYNTLLQGQRIEINDYTIKVLDVDKKEAKYIIEYKGELLNKGIIKQTMATGDTVNYVKLISVDTNGNSCVVEYEDVIYTIRRGEKWTMNDGTKISVIRVTPTKKQENPDYCTIAIEYEDYKDYEDEMSNE